MPGSAAGAPAACAGAPGRRGRLASSAAFVAPRVSRAHASAAPFRALARVRRLDAVTSARCSTHAEAEALVACGRCGRFLCEACVAAPIPDLPALGTHCPECAAKLGASPSRRARWSLGLGVFAFTGTLGGACIPVLNLVLLPAALLSGPLALGLSLAELAAIRRGDAPPRGERPARLARWLALAHLGLVALLLVVLFALRTASAEALGPD